jgi:hypothetical protein
MEPGLSTAHSRRESRADMHVEADGEVPDLDLKTQGNWGAVVGQIWESVREDPRLGFRCGCCGQLNPAVMQLAYSYDSSMLHHE